MALMPRLTIPGTALQRLRLEACLSREELAEKAEVSPATVKAIETGASNGVRPRTVRRLAVALGCRPEDIAEVVEVAS